VSALPQMPHFRNPDRKYLDENDLLQSPFRRPVPGANLLWQNLHVRDVQKTDGKQQTQNIRIFEQLSFVGVRLIFISQGIDTCSEQAEILMATHGIVDSLYKQACEGRSAWTLLSRGLHEARNGNAD